MKILVGDCRGHKQIAILKEHGWGRMFALVKPTPFEGECFGFDNLAYVYFMQGKSFDSDAYRRRLEVAQNVEAVPYIAIPPDIVAGGKRSLDFSWEWMAGRELARQLALVSRSAGRDEAARRRGIYSRRICWAISLCQSETIN